MIVEFEYNGETHELELARYGDGRRVTAALGGASNGTGYRLADLVRTIDGQRVNKLDDDMLKVRASLIAIEAWAQAMAGDDDAEKN